MSSAKKTAGPGTGPGAEVARLSEAFRLTEVAEAMLAHPERFGGSAQACNACSPVLRVACWMIGKPELPRELFAEATCVVPLLRSVEDMRRGIARAIRKMRSVRVGLGEAEVEEQKRAFAQLERMGHGRELEASIRKTGLRTAAALWAAGSTWNFDAAAHLARVLIVFLRERPTPDPEVDVARHDCVDALRYLAMQIEDPEQVVILPTRCAAIAERVDRYLREAKHV